MNTTENKNEQKRFFTAIIALILLIDIVLYGRALSSGLFLDDFYFCRPYSLKEVAGSFFGTWESLGMILPYYRPLIVLSYATDYLIWKDNFFGYHLTNLFIHTLVCCIILLLLLRLGFSRRASAIGAIAFAINANAAAGAAWIAERTDTLCAVFILIAVICFTGFAENKGRGRLLGVYLFYLLALACKEAAVTLTLVLVGFAYLRHKDLLRHAAWTAIVPFLYGIFRLAVIHHTGVPYILLLLALAGIIIWLVHRRRWKALAAACAIITLAAAALLIHKAATGPDHYPVDLALSIAFGLYLQLHKLLRVIMPLDLPAWGAFLYMLAAFCMLLQLVRSYRGHPASRTWGRLALFALVWIIAFNIPILHLSQRRMLYIPSIGMSILLAIGIEMVLSRAEIKRNGLNKIILVSATVIFLILSMAGNKEQQEKWTTNSGYIKSNELILYCEYADRLTEKNRERLAWKLNIQGYDLEFWCPKISEALKGKPFPTLHSGNQADIEKKPEE